MRFTIFVNWWAFAVRGALGVVCGAAALALPELALASFATLFGAYAVAEGLCNAVGAVRAARIGERRWPLLVGGLAGAAIGVLITLWPGAIAHALLSLVVVWLLATGIFELVAAAWLRKAIKGERLLALRGVVSVVFGFVLAAAGPSADTLRLWAGIQTLACGALLIALSLRLRALRPLAMRTSARLLPDF